MADLNSKLLHEFLEELKKIGTILFWFKKTPYGQKLL